MLLGTLIDGRYRVDALVAEGGFGAVYAAYHVGLGARVALKVPRVDDLPPREIAAEIASFLDEGRTLKGLRHPNVVAALDVGLLPPRADGLALPYLVLEWCDGPTLKEHLAELGRPLAIGEAWALLRPVVDGIAHAHAAGIAHRDVKPANVVLARTRGGLVPCVIDFGVAKRLGSDRAPGAGETRTLSDRRAFTPRYAAPEQLTGLRTGPATDVYALGLVLAEMLRGEPVHATDDDARRAVAESEPASEVALADETGPWRAVLARALASRPADRFEDAGALLRALDASIAPRGVAAQRPGAGDAPGAPIVAPPASDDTMIPSSRTARTLSRSAAPTARPAGGVVRPVLLGAGAAVIVAATVLLSPWQRGSRGDDLAVDGAALASSSAGSPTGSAPAASSTALPPRELSALTGEELVARATGAGFPGCRALESPQLVTVGCSRGTIVLRRGDTWGDMTPEEIRANLRHQAAMYAESYGAARVVTSGTWGLVVSADAPSIDVVTRQLLAGVTHGPVDVAPAPVEEDPIPPRLAGWTRRELAARVRAVGGDVTWESWSQGPATVSFVVGSDAGTATLVEREPEAWLAARRARGVPFAYAVDGDRLLASSGEGMAGRAAFVRSLLGTAAATRLEEVR